MKRFFDARTWAACAAAFATPLAWAHHGAGVAGAASGFAHPFTGIDHLLAMLAIGAWAAQQERRARWAIPLAFVVAMGVGALAGNAGLALPAVEPMIAASLVALGLAIALGVRAPAIAGSALAALFAVFHGHAHGAEAAGAPLVSYLGGMLAATAFLHVAGYVAGTAVRASALRWTAAAVAAGGAALLVAGA
jgi:urease accessory protein